MAITVLRFTFARPDPDPTQQSQVLGAALEMAKWGDTRGLNVGFVSLYPLCGAMPIDEGWKSLHLLSDVVIPRLQLKNSSMTWV